MAPAVCKLEHIVDCTLTSKLHIIRVIIANLLNDIIQNIYTLYSTAQADCYISFHQFLELLGLCVCTIKISIVATVNGKFKGKMSGADKAYLRLTTH